MPARGAAGIRAWEEGEACASASPGCSPASLDELHAWQVPTPGDVSLDRTGPSSKEQLYRPVPTRNPDPGPSLLPAIPFPPPYPRDPRLSHQSRGRTALQGLPRVA